MSGTKSRLDRGLSDDLGVNSDPEEDVRVENGFEKVKENQEQMNKFLWAILMRIMPGVRDLMIMGLVVVAYATFNNDVPKISNPPQPKPFFPQNSYVKDHFKGEILQTLTSTKDSDVTFVMFYAPWDRKCQESRKEFALAAEFMRNLVNFEAVNCWQPDSECRNHYNKVYSWPIFVVYLNHGRGLPFNGPIKAQNMVKFLNLVINPIRRIENGLDLFKMRTEFDVVVVANLDVGVDLKKNSGDYEAFYSIVLTFLEKDSFGEIGFGVKTEKCGFKKKLSIYNWNKTLIYSDPNWSRNNIIAWLIKNIHRLTTWVSPSGQKSTLLSKYVQPGPALVLFTPRNPLFDVNDYYFMLRELSLELFNCKNDSSSFENYLLRFGIRKRRLNDFGRFLNDFQVNLFRGFEKNESKSSRNENEFIRSCYESNRMISELFRCQSESIGSQPEFIPSDSKFILSDFEIIRGDSESIPSLHKSMQTISEFTGSEPESKRTNFDSSHSNFNSNYYKISLLPDLFDKKSPRNLKKILSDLNKDFKKFAQKFDKLYSTFNSNKMDLNGFLCNSNKTLSIIAMDSLIYKDFSKKFFKNPDKTSAIIIDDQNESFYVLNSPINDFTIRKFIKNFFNNNLNRSKSSFHPYRPAVTEKNFFVTELDSKSFLDFTTRRNKAVIVFYYTKHCAFCSGVAYKVLEVAKMLGAVKNLEFGRIDGDLNTLPWEFTMEKVPTLLFFPDEKKSETRVFPRSTPITITTLINFILTNLSPVLKVHAMWSICNQIKFEGDRKKCIVSIRLETLTLIERTLHEWRKASFESRSFLIDKLSTLRRLHLILGDKNDFEAVQELFIKLGGK